MGTGELHTTSMSVGTAEKMVSQKKAQLERVYNALNEDLMCATSDIEKRTTFHLMDTEFHHEDGVEVHLLDAACSKNRSKAVKAKLAAEKARKARDKIKKAEAQMK